MEQFYIKAGEMLFRKKEAYLKTHLGSCVALCLWDEVMQTGSINHYLLPRQKDVAKDPLYFGEESNKLMIEEMINGGSKLENIRVLVVGGGSINADSSPFSIGAANIDVALDALEDYGIREVQKSVGGDVARKISFNVESGIVKIKEIDMKSKAICQKECRLMKNKKGFL